MFSWEAAASVVEPLRQDPVVCGPTTAPPSVLLMLASLPFSLISFNFFLLLLHLVLPLLF